MKKILFALIGIVVMTLTSCFPEPEHLLTQSFSRLVSIDTTGNYVSFKADYTGEVFTKFSNVTYTEDLAAFNLEGAKRAEVLIRHDVDASYKQTLTLLNARKIDVLPITKQATTETQMPLLKFWGYPLTSFLRPTVWVSNGYLNMLPVVPSAKSAKYRLTPEKVISDSLYFRLTATYEEDSLKQLVEDIHCYDLRTLRDTSHADAELRKKMEEVLTAMENLKKDSMRIFVTADFIEYNYKGRKDTIRTFSHITNYFKYDF